MKNINAKKLSYRQLEERYKNLEKRYEELQELLFAVAACWTKKQSKEFAKFQNDHAKTFNRKLTQKDFEEARKIIQRSKNDLKELLEAI